MGNRVRRHRGERSRRKANNTAPMSAPGPAPIVVPREEIARQATAALEGYSYQLYQTVAAWLSLRPDERLHIEFAEDFAVSDDGALTLTQVKKVAAPLSLRSAAVAALIRSVWAFQNANPSRAIAAALITTGKIGKEKNLAFPGNASGLAYWRVAAREQADVEPIRTALRELDLPADLKAFLESGSPGEIRDRILRPIRWFGSGPSKDEIEDDLNERLVHFGSAQGVGAQDSKNALNALIVELLGCLSRSAESRYVTSADLLTVFQKNTYRLVPPSQIVAPATVAGGKLADTELATSDAISIPLPPRAALRPDLIGDLHGALVENGTLWLQGSSGLGKTTLALLLVRHQNSAWTFADLRNLGPRALRLVLTRLSATFGASGARGLVLDDLPADPDNAAILAIKRVARAVANADGLLIVTSPKRPAPTLASGLNLVKNAIREVPYLTEDDVGEIIRQAGGDPRIWGRVVFMFCGGGHPQLVDARVMGLRHRGWPLEERFSDLVPFKRKSGDLEAERESVRARLLRELDAQSRELLLRLSLLMNNFDRSIMFAVACALPVIPQAGMLFDVLVGPWIEQVGSERYRLSPLLRDSGEAGLAKAQCDTIRSTVLEHLTGRRPFPADQLNQFFLFAFTLKRAPALTWFSGMLVHSAAHDQDVFKRIAEELSVFAMADRGEAQLLFPENALVSTMLRQAQLRVAIATKDGKRAAQILERILFEIDQLVGAAKSHNLSLALATALMERCVPLAPKSWVGMLQTLSAIPSVRRTIRQRPSYTDPYSGLVQSASHAEMMFIIRATALESIDQLSELVETLDALPARLRERYLSAMSRLFQSTHHVVASAWLSAVRKEGFDGKAAAATFAKLTRTASRWKNTELAIEMMCAQAVMLDEYAEDKDGALKVLTKAQAKYPQNYRINRQRQKVYYRNGDHARALAEFGTFADAFPAMGPVDRAFSLREAGRSAAELGELERTRLFFDQAWEAARQCGDHMWPMTAGLSADCAILDFQAGKIDSALALMMRALIESEPIDPEKGLKEHYCVLILMTAIMWMRGSAADWPVERQAMVIGMCSNPDPLPEIKDRPLPQRLLHWYELSELEAETSDRQRALAALRERTGEGGLLPMEAILTFTLLQSAVRRLDVDRFLDALAIYPRAGAVAKAIIPNQRPEDFFAMPIGHVKRIGEAEWSDHFIKEAATSAVLVFAVVAVCSCRGDVYDQLHRRVMQAEGLGPALAPLFNTITSPPEKPSDVIVAVASTLSRMLKPDFVFNASEAFVATVYLAQLVSDHILGEVAAGVIVAYFSNVWRDILANRTFSVRGPATNGPLILAALSKGQSNRAKLANLVLTSEAAARERLSDGIKGAIRAMAEPKRKAEPEGTASPLQQAPAA